MNMSPWIALLAIQFTLGLALGGALVWAYVRRKKIQGAPSGFCLSDADPTAEIEEGYWGLYGSWKEASEVRHDLIGHRLRNFYEDVGEGDIPRRDDIEILPVWIGKQ